MLEKVQPKTKILASQYNDLVAAVQGPINASESIPFTQTKNGIVLNGGNISYAAKPPAKVPTALEVLVTNGRLTSAYDGYVAAGNAQTQGDANRFSGVLLNLGEGTNIMNTICWSTFRQGRAEVPMICIIDPTSQGAKLVPLNLAAMRENPSGQWPLCEVSQNAGIAVVQITKASSQSIVGDILAIAGNWEKLGASSGESVSPLTTADLGNIVASINAYSTATEARVLRMTSLWLGQPWLASGVQNVPQVAYTVGIQDIFPQPDIYPPTESLNCEKLSTWLSSITYVPRQQLGFDPLFSTFVYTLNNFDKLSSTYADIDELKAAPDLITQLSTTNELSAFDLLIRHKKPHPDNYDGQAAACLEYVSLEGLLDNLSGTVDSSISALQLSSIQDEVYTDPDTGKDTKYHQLFGFEENGTVDPSNLSGIDVVVRESQTTDGEGARVNYIPLSSLHLSSDVNFQCSMKASLFCYDVETGVDAQGNIIVLSSRWAWRVWLGEGASYSGGFASGDAVTVGGNRVLFECAAGAPSRSYDGRLLWWDNSLVFGIRIVPGGGQIPGGQQLWLSYAPDSTKGGVIGTFHGVGPGQPPDWQNSGLLQDSAFVAEHDAWTTPIYASQLTQYMELPLDVVKYGTFGHQNEGFPLLDRYWPSPSMTSRSLDWTSRNGQANNVVVQQLYKFDQLSNVNPLSSDDVLIRRREGTGGQILLDYVPVSALIGGEARVDTIETHQTQCSIDKKTDQTTGNPYLQLYNFELTGQADQVLTVNLSYGNTRYAYYYGNGQQPDTYAHFVVRDAYQNNIVKYDSLAIYAPPIYATDILDLSTTISGWGFICSCDCAALSAEIAAVSSDLSNYWKCGGTYDDNCYGHSIGDASQVLAIDIDNGGLWYGSSQTIDWHACELYDSNGAGGPGNICLNWFSRTAYNSGGASTLDWEQGKLYESTGLVDTVDWENCYLRNPTDGANAVDWSSRILNDADTYSSVEWGNRYLMDSSAQMAVDWDNRMLIPAFGSPTVEWGNCILNDLNSTQSLDWDNKELIGDWSCPYGDFSIGSGFTLKIGNTTLTEAQLQQLLALLQVVPNALQGV